MTMQHFSEQSVIEHFCSFLSNVDRVALLSTSSKLARTWLQRMRLIVLRDEDAFRFIVEAKFQKLILSMIHDPRKQLDLIFDFLEFESDSITKKQTFRSFNCPGLRRWDCNGEFFAVVMGKVSKGNLESIESLRIYGEVREAVPYLSRVKTSLAFLEAWSVPSTIDFLSPTLEELELNESIDLDLDESFHVGNEGPSTFSLQVLPNLKKLKLIRTNIANLADFGYLEELIFEKCDISVIPATLSRVTRLTLDRCPEISDLTPLQDNQEITATKCLRVKDVSQCFKNSKRINLCFEKVRNPYGVDEEEDPNESAVHVDLAYYSLCEQFSLDASFATVWDQGQLCFQELVPSQLSVVSLTGIYQPISFKIFQNVQKVELIFSTLELSLEGLEKVPIVVLQQLYSLKSLVGLEQNQKVVISQCHDIADFSPLRYVNTVRILDCLKFKDITHLDHVKYLTICDCPFLCDVTPLGRVPYDPTTQSYPIQSLTIRDCSKIRSLEGLAEVIPVISCSDCRNLRRHDRPKLRVGVGVDQSDGERVMTMRGILSLPDSVYGIMFEYLTNEEVIEFLSTTAYLYDTLMKKHRVVTIRKEERLFDFFTDSRLTIDVLDKIEQPYNQLKILENGTLINETAGFAVEEIPMDLPIRGFRELDCLPELFLFLCEQRSQPSESDWFVKELTLRADQVEEVHFDGSKLLPYLYKARQRLILERIHFLPNALNAEHFASTLEELVLSDFAFLDEEDEEEEEEDDDDGVDRYAIMLPVLPNLIFLQVINSTVLNLNEFSYLQELHLESIDGLDSVAVFHSIRQISLIDLPDLSDISPLQNNEIVAIWNCPEITNLKHCFPKVKKLRVEAELGRTWIVDDITLDLSHYPLLEGFALNGATSTGRFGGKKLTEQLCSTDQLPASLKMVHLSYLLYFSRTNLFHSVQQLTLSHCPRVVSVEGLGSVKELTLMELDDLSSLEGLRPSRIKTQVSQKKRASRSHKKATTEPNHEDEREPGNQSVTIIECPRIKDFSPLRRVPQVTLISCDGLRKGEDLDRVKFLTIQDCDNLKDISMLTHAEKLTVMNCESVKKLGKVAELVPQFIFE